MGIGVVLLFWAVIGLVLAGIGFAAFGAVTARATRGIAERVRKRAILIAGLFPLVCLAWAGFVFVLQATVNEIILQRDAGIGDSWHAPLPNGYHLLMIDQTDSGWVYNPRTQGANGGVGEQEDAIADVHEMQLSGKYIVGTCGRGLGASSGTPIEYFILDTGRGKQDRYPNQASFLNAAQQRGVKPTQMQPIEDVYRKFRFTWFDFLAGALLTLPPLAGFALLIRWILRLRRQSDSELLASHP